MKEIIIVTPRREGLLSAVTQALADANINIEEFEAQDVKDFSTVRMEVDRYDDALVALRDAGFEALTEDVVVIKLKDEPGALARLAKRLQDNGIGIRSVRSLHRSASEVMVALSMDRTDEAMALIEDLLICRVS